MVALRRGKGDGSVSDCNISSSALAFDESDEYPELLLLLLSSSTSTGGAPPRVDFAFDREAFVRAFVRLASRASRRYDRETSALDERVGEFSCVDRSTELCVSIARLEASSQTEPVPIEAAIVRSSCR